MLELRLTSSKIGEREYDLMQVLGELSNLKRLFLVDDAYLGRKLSCKVSAFPQLHELELNDLQSLEEWVMEEGSMARLN